LSAVPSGRDGRGRKLEEKETTMTPTHETTITASRLASLLDELSAGCDADFDAASDDIEREFAELRLTHAE
jgi:hypothetical protein